jgi:hypothetical protein
MTDDTKVPDWLERKKNVVGFDEIRVSPAVADELNNGLDGDAWHMGAAKSLEKHVAWRERVAAALGLVDRDAVIGLSYRYEENDLPQPMCYLDHQDRDAIAEHIRAAVGVDEQRTYVKTAEEWSATEAAAGNKAIAAELRRLADECRPCTGWMSGYRGSEDPEWLAHRLRARADELDPPTGG